MAGYRIVSRPGWRSRRYCGNEATNSLVPTQTATSVAGSTLMPRRRANQPEIAWRSAGDPIEDG